MTERVDSTAPSARLRRRKRARRGAFGGIPLGSISGFQISLDYSWFIIFFLILATFTGVVFPQSAPGLERGEYFAMGFAGTFLFFASLLVHELAHAFMARARDIEVEGITLFIFGGMARTAREPSTPGDEFVIAGVGPAASFGLAGFFHLVAVIGALAGLGPTVTVVAAYLAILNLVLAIFNLLPGFPLDGGRLLRAALWHLTGSLRRATRDATLAGRILGWTVIALGVATLVVPGGVPYVGGGLIGGLWLVFIGWFLSHAAGMSYQQVLLQEMLSPLAAWDAMSANPETVPPDLSVDGLIHEYFLRRPYSAFPVTDDGVIVGLVTLGQVKEVPRDQWEWKVVSDVMSPLENTVIVTPDTPMTVVLERMRAGDTRRALVAHEWELMGIISSTDITKWLDRVSLLG